MLPKTRRTINTKLKVTVWTFRAVAFVFLFIFSFHLFGDVLYAAPSSVAEDQFGIEGVGENISIPSDPNSDIRVIIVRIINVVLTFLGIVAVGFVLYAGYLWMTSSGNEEQVAQAKKMLVNGVIGLTIILSAFGVTSYILRSLINSINGSSGGVTTGTRPAVATYTFSGSLGSVIKDHYPRRDQREVPRNTSIVVTFGVPVAPSSLIENINRTCWSDDWSQPTTICKTPSGGVVDTNTPLDQIVNPYYGDCVDTNNDGTVSVQSECDRLITDRVVFDERSLFTSAVSEGGSIGKSAAALTTYDLQRNAFTFVIKPYEYLGSSSEDIEYRVRLTPEIMRADNGQSVFENQFSDGYVWDFTTGNTLDLAPPHVLNVYPETGSIIPKNSIIQITFDEPIDPTTVESIVNEGSNNTFVSTLLNQKIGETLYAVSGSWRLTNGYTTLEFTPSADCGVNSCGEKMFCLEVDCSGATCTNSYEALLRTAEWTRNSQSPFESVPFSGIYDLAFNGLDNTADNETSNHLTKPDLNTAILIQPAEKKPDNYWWSFQVSNTIDRSAPYIEEIIPGVDAEDISGSIPVSIRFSKRMMSATLQGVDIRSGISLLEHPTNICSDAAIDTESPNECSDDARLDNLWFRVGSVIVGDKTRAILDHREFGPNGLDLYYIPSVPSTVKSVTQNCVYPGIGPWTETPAPSGEASVCEVTYDKNGYVQSSVGCVGVTHNDALEDTGCVYTLGSGYTAGSPSDPIFRASDIESCVNRLYTESQNSY